MENAVNPLSAAEWINVKIIRVIGVAREIFTKEDDHVILEECRCIDKHDIPVRRTI